MPTTSRVVPVLSTLSALALVATLAACSSSGTKSDKSSSAGPATPASSSTGGGASTVPASGASDTGGTADYTALLIDASDIPVPGVTKGTAAAPPSGAGATVAFTATGGRSVGDTVLVLPDAAAAKTAANASVSAAKQGIEGAVATDAPIGDGGTAIRGTKSGQSVAVLVFSEGKAFVVLEFDSAASDPVPTDVIQQVATAQDDKIKSGLG